MKSRRFIIEIIEDDIPEKSKSDLEDILCQIIIQEFDIDYGVSFSLEEE